jgi:hypothetical protein
MADVGMYASSPMFIQPHHQNYDDLVCYAREGQAVKSKSFLFIFTETRSGRVQTRPVPGNYFGHLKSNLV